MFDFDNTVQIGAEIPLHDQRFTIQQDIGYGNANFNVWYSEGSERPNKYTIKSRTQFRFYFVERPRFRSYVAGEYLHKRVVRSEDRWAGRDCAVTGGCSFFEYARVQQGRFVKAFHAKVGWQFYFPNRTSLDIFAGMGMRQARVKTITPGFGDVNLGSDFWWSNSNGVHQVIPSLAIGFHLGLALGKFDKPKSEFRQ